MSLDDSFIGRFFGEKYDHLWLVAVFLTAFIIGLVIGLVIFP